MDLTNLRNSQSELMTMTGNPTNADKALINHLFRRLAAMFPAWKSAFDSEDTIKETKRVWFDSLVREGLTNPEDIERGLVKASKHDSPFLPSIGQFLGWCKQSTAPYHQQFRLEEKGEKATPEAVKKMLIEAGLAEFVK